MSSFAFLPHQDLPSSCIFGNNLAENCHSSKFYMALFFLGDLLFKQSNLSGLTDTFIGGVSASSAGVDGVVVLFVF